MSDCHDLIIRNGLVVDGSGGEPYLADVAVDSGKVSLIGNVQGSTEDEIDAQGCIVTPGFVDIHTHYDGQITWENRLSPSSNHGVTTVVMGNCGVGFAPVRPDQHDLVIKLMEGVEDIPDVVMQEGVPWNWESFPEYLDAIAKRPSDIDFAAQLPHSPLRVYVMGERGVDLEPPTERDLAEMRRLTAEAIRAGAIGVTTSLNLVHRFRDGRPAPSVRTQEDEILALANGLRDAGAGVFQMLSDTQRSPEHQYQLLRNIAKTSGRPVSFTFSQVPGQPGTWRVILDYLLEAKAEGLKIKGQVLPRPTGALLGLQLSFHPFSLNPSFRAIADLPLEQKVVAMCDPEMRERLLSETPDDPHEFFKYVISDMEEMFVLGDPPNYNPSREDSIASRARRVGKGPNELIYDALLELDGRQILYRPLGNAEGDRFESSGRNLLKTDVTVLGLGDGGAHYSMICDAAYSTYLLTYWSRDAPEDRKLELPWAIKKLAHEPAIAVNLRDRGLLKVGYKADINIIDMDGLKLHAPEVRYDLPAGGRRLIQRSEGYRATIVSGKITYRDGESTGVLPGKLVRGAQPEPLTVI